MTVDRARDLRTAFDAAFSRPPPEPQPGAIDLLRIHVGADRYVVAMSEVAAVHVDRHVCPVPSAAPALLGLVAVRSAIVPLYDLRAILGITATGVPRWCLVARAASAAFAFDAFEGLERVSPAQVRAEPRLISLAAIGSRLVKED